MKGFSPTADPDPGLVRRAQQGERGALKTLLQEVSGPIRQWALAHTGDPDRAADLAQEVCVLLLRKLHSFRGDSRFLTWLFTVTRNQALESHRRSARHERKMDRLKTRVDGTGGVEPDAGAGIDRARLGELISAFVHELPQRQREVFQLSEFQGISSPEIGELLQIDPGSVRAALFKARRTLRRRILDAHPEFVEEYLP